MNRRPTSDSRRIAFLFVATILFGLSVRGGIAASLLVISAAVLLGVGASSSSRGGGDALAYSQTGSWDTRLMIAIVAWGSLGALGWAPSTFGPTYPVLERVPGLFWIVLTIAFFVTRVKSSDGFRIGIVFVTITATIAFGVAHLAATTGVGIDVYFLHIEAANALANGENPYTDVVEVKDGSPLADADDTITGYVYPPVTALSYALGYWLFSDPRYTSLITWAVFLAVLGAEGVRGRSSTWMLIMLLMASMPSWPMVLRGAWTEPLSLALLAAAFVIWRRPVVSGLFLGLAFASKQYFAVVAPAVFLHHSKGWVRRAAAGAGVVFVTVGAAMMWNLQAFWDSAIQFHLSTPPRPDSSNLVGLVTMLGSRWDPPGFLPILVGLVFTVFVIRLSQDRSGLLLGIGLALSMSFLVASQAFANYWFLITGLCGLILGDALVGDSAPDADVVRSDQLVMQPKR